MSNSEKGEPKIEVFHRVNKLKLKAGAGLNEGDGFIDPAAVNRADTVITRKEVLYKDEVKSALGNLNAAWEKMKSGDENLRLDGVEELYHYSNHIKDIAMTYHYDLMAHFGGSLRKFAEKVDVSNKAHLVIAQAHIDVMWVVYKENIKNDGGKKAQELKEIVAQAIRKYF